MRKWVHDNPWVWVLALILLMMGMNAAFVTIAVQNAPEMIEH
jgi:hypothetical protein